MKQQLLRILSLTLLLTLVLALPGVVEDAVNEDISNNNDVVIISTNEDEAVVQSPDISHADSELLMQEVTEPSMPETEEVPATGKPATVEAQPKAASAIPKTLIMGVKEKYTIDTSGLTGQLTFKSSKKAVATVSKKGVITAKATGQAKITITPKKGKKRTITVRVMKAPTKVTLDNNKLSMETGDEFYLFATIPDDTASNLFTWTSSNTKVVKISKDKGDMCIFKALKAGTATITVKTFNGKKATCKVKVVKPKPIKLTVSKKSVSIKESESITVKVTYTGNDSIYWKSDDYDVASCEWEEGWNGNTCELTIKGEAPGSTTITVYNKSSDKSVSIKVTVLYKELLRLYGKSVDTVNKLLSDKLTYSETVLDEYVYYSNGIFDVKLDSYGEIDHIFLHKGDGKYTLNWIYPGESSSSAEMTVESTGWRFSEYRDIGSYYINSSFPGRELRLVFQNNKVLYVRIS